MKHVQWALQQRQNKHSSNNVQNNHGSIGMSFWRGLLAVVLVVLVGTAVSASDYDVTATVPAQMPPGKPVITTPGNNTTSNSQDIVIAGTCPVAVPPVVVIIYDTDTLIGSSACTVDGTFSIVATLQYGQHALKAVMFTITGQKGQESDIVTYKNSKVTNVQAPSAGDKPSQYAPIESTATPAIDQPLFIETSTKYLLLQSDKSVVWQGKFSNGTLPYTIKIDWGDGKADTYTVTDSSEQTYRHTYERQEAYVVVIRASDAKGKNAVIYTSAVTVALQQKAVVDTKKEKPPVTMFTIIRDNSVGIALIFGVLIGLIVWLVRTNKR